MSYKTLYRKYRPVNFDDVVGQEHIVKTLKNIIESRKISHAYLFCGPKGTGKTSLAKIFSNVVNCMHSEDVTSICPNCLQNINDSIDIIEMDAASNNGVDEIRDLKEKIEQSPLRSRYKVYIIDEAHMLTKNAFNALLKTLEEPPKHVIFILATTDPHKIPVTILSRVQRFNFQRLSENQITKHLEYVLKKENIEYEPKALKSIATLSSGGMRDALSITDQISIFGNNKVTEKLIQEHYGILSLDEVIMFINKIIECDVDYVLNKLHDFQYQGIDFNQFLLNLVKANKEWIIAYKTNDSNLIEYLTVEKIKELVYPTFDISLTLSEAFYEIMVEMNKNDYPFDVLELGILKLINKIKTTQKEASKQIPVVQNQQKVNIQNESFIKPAQTPIKEENKQQINYSKESTQLDTIITEIAPKEKSDNLATYKANLEKEVIEKEIEQIPVKKQEEYIFNSNPEEYQRVTKEIKIDHLNKPTAKVTKPSKTTDVTVDEIMLDYAESQTISPIEEDYSIEELAKFAVYVALDPQKSSDNKMYLNEIQTKIKKMRLTKEENYEQISKILSGVSIITVGPTYILVVGDDQKVQKIHKNKNNLVLQTFFKKLIGKYMHVIPITHDEQEVMKSYFTKWKTNNFADVKNVQIPSELITLKSDVDPETQAAYEIFGTQINIVKKD